MKIDLTKLFPVSPIDGSQGPLPKQQEFLDCLLNHPEIRNIAYFGGYGSGKSLILCIANILQGVMYGGEYVIARQYMPELRRTTMRIFHEMLPPELILEKKDAVAETVIKSVNGTARFYFVGLDEPEKLDSLSLDGASIDEASQTTEEAFLKLKGRLRGTRGLKKMLLVGNPKGHDYVYKNFINQNHFKEFIHPVNKRVITEEEQKKEYRLILAPSTENRHLDDNYIQGMLSTYSPERIKRDIYGSFDSFEGQVYSEFDRGSHVIRPFRIPDNWDRHIRIDHGYKNPAAVLFFAISPDGDVYVYRELYVREWLIRQIVNGDKKEKKHGIFNHIQGVRSFKSAKIDPSTKARRGTTGESDFDEYWKQWPEKDKLPLQLAKNAVELGIDRVKQYLKPHPKTNRPSLYFFDTCINLLEEITTYKYPELGPGEVGKKSDKEAPLKVNDHALDALRYMILDLPIPYTLELRSEDRHLKYTRSEISMQDDFAKACKPQEPKDPFSDGI